VDISIVIVNWNTQQITCDCLRSVYEQTSGLEYEVIVVDNHSSDGSVEAIGRGFPQVKLVVNTRNRGFAAANNQGIGVARGRYVLLLNSDTLILDQAIPKTVRFADQHPEAAVVGCRILNEDRTLQRTCFQFPSLLNMVLSSTYLYKLFPRNGFFGREEMTWWDHADIREVEVIKGCFMVVRKDAVARVGALDESYFMYCEETDWCYRFQKAGWKCLFFPDAQSIHLDGQSTRRIRPAMELQKKASILQFMRKHRGPIQYAIACVLTSLFLSLRAPHRFVLCGENANERALGKAYLKGACRAYLGWRGLACRPPDNR